MLVVKGSDTLDDLKTMIAHGPWDIMQNEQVLKFKGLQLHEDRHTLSHYNIQNNDTVTCRDISG